MFCLSPFLGFICFAVLPLFSLFRPLFCFFPLPLELLHGYPTPFLFLCFLFLGAKSTTLLLQGREGLSLRFRLPLRLPLRLALRVGLGLLLELRLRLGLRLGLRTVYYCDG